MQRTLRWLVAVLAVATITLATANADPFSDLQQSQKKFYSLKSWHADLTTAGQTLSMDFVAPDRFREMMPRGMTFIVIGSTGWMTVGGRTQQLPGSMIGPFQSRLQTVHSLGLQGDLSKDFTLSYTGMKSLNGEPVRTYRLVKKSDSGYTIDWWIGSNDLPVESVVNDDGKTITIVFSAFNSPITIASP